MTNGEKLLTGLFAAMVVTTVTGKPRNNKRRNILIGDVSPTWLTPANVGIGLAGISIAGLIAQGYYNNNRQLQRIPFETTALAGAAIWGIDTAYNKFFPDTALQNTSTAEAQNEIDKLIAAGQKPTYDDNVYSDKADSIYELVRHSYPFGGGSSYDQVRDILLTMANDLDIAKLIKAFGFRERDYFGIVPDGSDKNLPTFVTELMGTDRINAINQAYNNNGMNYQF